MENLRPRDAPGFAAAVAAGQTPARPDDPPVVGEPSAHQALVRLGWTVAVAAGVAVTSVLLLSVDGALGGLQLVVFLAVLAVGYVVSRAAVIRFRTLLLGELQAGHTTTTFLQGGFWMRNRQQAGRRSDAGLGWTWEGLWVLTSAGRVVSTPDRTVDPPGIYPSPYAEGRKEIWTGSEWSGVLVDGSVGT